MLALTVEQAGPFGAYAGAARLARPRPSIATHRDWQDEPVQLSSGVRLALRCGMLLGAVNVIAAGYVVVLAVREALFLLA